MVVLCNQIFLYSKKTSKKGPIMYKYIGIFVCSTLIGASDNVKLTSFQLTSPAFQQGETIDSIYTCSGKNKMPVLSWTGVPKNTETFAIICDDPDAPTAEPWVHWVVFNIPGTTTSLTKSLGRTKQFEDGTTQGMNTSSRIGYDGPCPPRAKVHRYFFKIYALDTELKLNAGSTKKQLLNAMKGHILAQAELMGTYKR